MLRLEVTPSPDRKHYPPVVLLLLDTDGAFPYTRSSLDRWGGPPYFPVDEWEDEVEEQIFSFSNLIN